MITPSNSPKRHVGYSGSSKLSDQSKFQEMRRSASDSALPSSAHMSGRALRKPEKPARQSRSYNPFILSREPSKDSTSFVESPSPTAFKQVSLNDKISNVSYPPAILDRKPSDYDKESPSMGLTSRFNFGVMGATLGVSPEALRAALEKPRRAKKPKPAVCTRKLTAKPKTGLVDEGLYSNITKEILETSHTDKCDLSELSNTQEQIPSETHSFPKRNDVLSGTSSPSSGYATRSSSKGNAPQAEDPETYASSKLESISPEISSPNLKPMAGTSSKADTSQTTYFSKKGNLNESKFEKQQNGKVKLVDLQPKVEDCHDPRDFTLVNKKQTSIIFLDEQNPDYDFLRNIYD